MLKSVLATVFATMLLVGVSPRARAADYCLAVRGNGELEPAHWGGVAKILESLGLPKAQAGGSSASITMFLLDAVASNPLIKNSPKESQGLKAALLVKSFEGFVAEVMGSPQFQDFLNLYANIKQLKDVTSLDQLAQILKGLEQNDPQALSAKIRQSLDLLQSSFMTAVKLGLIGQDDAARMQASLKTASPKDLARIEFQISELMDSAKRLGAFDANTDDNLFFRRGVVDFDRLATQVGRIGDFYANADWGRLFDECALKAKGKLWPELVQSNPQCAKDFKEQFSGFLTIARASQSAKNVGVTIPSFPSTAILTGPAQVEFAQAMSEYSQAMSKTFGRDFHLHDVANLHFGYWGNEQGLLQIEKNLDRSDEKSRRFMSLGQAPWHEVLSLSPAEPGLSPLKFFSHGPKTFVSAGGWSDLHPVLVLKAYGCQDVVYLTRRGEESVFAMGVARRMFGDQAQEILPKLYDLKDSLSSFKKSLSAASAVLCTDWNAFSIQAGVHPMIQEAYEAPFYLTNRGRESFKSNRLSPILNSLETSKDGSAKFVGCF